MLLVNLVLNLVTNSGWLDKIFIFVIKYKNNIGITIKSQL